MNEILRWKNWNLFVHLQSGRRPRKRLLKLFVIYTAFVCWVAYLLVGDVKERDHQFKTKFLLHQTSFYVLLMVVIPSFSKVKLQVLQPLFRFQFLNPKRKSSIWKTKFLLKRYFYFSFSILFLIFSLLRYGFNLILSLFVLIEKRIIS